MPVKLMNLKDSQLSVRINDGFCISRRFKFKISLWNRKPKQGYVFKKGQYPVTAHAPIFDFRTGRREIKTCEESTRTLKNRFASRLAEFSTTLKLLRVTDQWHIVPVKFSICILPLAGGPKDGKPFGADWTLISSASFHTSSDNCERNTQKWNSNNKDLKKKTIKTLMWVRKSCETSTHKKWG